MKEAGFEKRPPNSGAPAAHSRTTVGGWRSTGDPAFWSRGAGLGAVGRALGRPVGVAERCPHRSRTVGTPDAGSRR